MQSDTVSALRDLYRASEARAARLRLLMEAGRDLAVVESTNLNSVLAQSARRAALFAGCREGEVSWTRPPMVCLWSPRGQISGAWGFCGSCGKGMSRRHRIRKIRAP
jgi:hypothetical protein